MRWIVGLLMLMAAPLAAQATKDSVACKACIPVTQPAKVDSTPRTVPVVVFDRTVTPGVTTWRDSIVQVPVVVVPPTESTVVVLPPPVTGTGEPTPRGTIYYDSRAGGAHDWQKVNDIAGFKATLTKLGNGSIIDTKGTSIAWATNYDGKGKHAIRFDWPQTSGENQERIFFYLGQSPTRIYTSVVIHFGRTATGGGLGAIGSFIPVTEAGGMKRILWLRRRDNGADPRVYWNIPRQKNLATLGHKLSIDSYNLDNSWTAPNRIGVDVRYTFELLAGSPCTYRVWQDGVKVADQTASCGTLPFEELTIPSTFLATAQAQSEYWTDLVIWGN